jgi:anti-sigma regulatory factor (Ser/Thr protein kinase)
VTLELELPRDLGSAAAARQAIGELTKELSEDLLGDVRLLVSELVTNALRHADLDSDGHIHLRVRVSKKGVRVEVSDPGNGFDPGDVPEDPETADGWGLYLVATLSDRWGVERQGTTIVWFELDRREVSDAA